MKARHLIILAVAAAIAILATLWTGSLHDTAPPAGVGTLLAPGLEAKLNDVTAVVVKGKDKTVTLEKGTNTWIVREKSGYAADTGKVRKLLIGLSKATLLEQKTSNPERFGELGVADLEAAPADTTPPADATAPADTAAEPATTPGALVDVQVPLEGTDHFTLLVGKTARGATGTYVRKSGDTQSWLARGDLSVDTDPLNWIDRQILDVAANRVQQVTIRHPDGQTLVLGKETREEPNYHVHDLPAKGEIKFDSVGNPLASVLASLRLDDVYMLAEKDPGPHAPIEAEYRTFDGLIVTAQAYSDGDKRYVHFRSRFDEEQAKRFYVAPAPAATPPPAEGEAAASPDAATSEAAASDASSGEATTPAAAASAETAAPVPAPAEPEFSSGREEAETLDRRVEPWVFAIANYKYEQIDKRVADMLKDEAKPAE